MTVENIRARAAHAYEQLRMKRPGFRGVMGLSNIFWGVGFAGIVLAIVLYVLNQVSISLPANSAAQNATNSTIVTVAGLTSWLTIVAIIAIAAIVMAYFALFRNRGTSG